MNSPDDDPNARSAASLDDLVLAAREADPNERINLRNAIASHGETAIDAMADLLMDRRLAAFAVRVLERIGNDPAARASAVAALTAADISEWPDHLKADLERSLLSLGHRRRVASGRTRAPRIDRPVGSLGVAGCGYWVMRTSPWQRPFLWAEAVEGRLRQGWGLANEQNLETIAHAIHRGIELTALQREARGALRMLGSWHNGIHVGDIVVAPNLPAYGRFSVFRVTGSYYWAPERNKNFGHEAFGHVLPVELVLADVDRRDGRVSEALRGALRGQLRLYNISGYGGEVERLIGGEPGGDGHRERWIEVEYELLFSQFPADGGRPTEAQADELALELGRPREAVTWQWDDGATYVKGRAASTTSDVLKQWLDRKV